MNQKPKVVIIGAGFGGISAAKTLRKAPVEVLMIDRRNYHTFQMLIYQVATAALAPEHIAYPVRSFFRRQQNFRFRQGSVSYVDWHTKTVLMSDETAVPFDYLIVAAGTTVNDYGVPGVKQHAHFLHNLDDAIQLRGHIYGQLERLAADPNLSHQGVFTFTVVGGGPTGVELAGALAELLERVPLDFPELKGFPVKVVLLERLGTLLPSYSEKSRRYAEDELRRRGVEVRLNTVVKAVHEKGVEIEGGEVVPTDTLIWAAGLRAGPLSTALGAELARGDRVEVERDLSLPGHPQAFIVGDMSGVVDEHGVPYPQVAQVAIQQRRHAAKGIFQRIQGEPTRPFRYSDPGNMAIIGRGAAVAEFGKVLFGIHLRGILGWLAWLFVHFVKLYGLRDRAHILLSWLFEAVTRDRPARLATAESAHRRQAFVMKGEPRAIQDPMVAEDRSEIKVLTAHR